MARKQRKYNIVIKNMEWRQNAKNNAIKEFIREELGIHAQNEFYELEDKIIEIYINNHDILVFLNFNGKIGKKGYFSKAGGKHNYYFH